MLALGQILSRELTAVEVPTPAVVEQLRGYGVSGWETDGLAELLEVYASGAATAVAPDAQAVLGRPTRTWEDFVTDHIDVFTGADQPA